MNEKLWEAFGINPTSTTDSESYSEFVGKAGAPMFDKFFDFRDAICPKGRYMRPTQSHARNHLPIDPSYIYHINIFKRHTQKHI